MRFLGAVTALGLLLGVAPPAQAADDDVTVYVTFEGYNLGQGYYVEPVELTVPAGSTVAGVSESVLEDTAHAFQAADAGNTTSTGWYLGAVQGFDTGNVSVPSYISSQPGFELTGTDGDDYLGQFDYNGMSGWMYTVDNVTAQVGAGAYPLEDGDVVRWQFTLYGYGCDLGLADSCYEGSAYFSQVDKTALVRRIGTGPSATATPTELAAARTVAVDPTATQQEVAATQQGLDTGPNTPPVSAATTVARQEGAAWLARELAANDDVLALGSTTDWGLTADALFALAGAGVGGDQIARTAEALYHSGTAYVGTPAGLAMRWPFLAKTVLALQIAGLDPTTFPDGTGTRDLVADLRSSVKQDGSWTNTSDAFKTSLGILALARTDQGVPVAAIENFEERACADSAHVNYGAFGFSGGCSADVDTTAMAVQALVAAGAGPDDPSVTRATSWLLAQDPAAGFPSAMGPGNTNTSGLAAQALFAVGESAAAGHAVAFIEALQIDCSTTALVGVTDPVVAGTITAAHGALAYSAAGWTTAMNAGITSTNRDQWRRASAQAVLGLGAESLGFITAADATSGVPEANCPPPVIATSLTATIGATTYGKAGTVAVTVVPASGTAKPTGTVSTKIGTRTVSGALIGGRSTLTLPARSLPPGSRTLTITFAGTNGSFADASKTVPLWVSKASPAVKVTGPKQAKRGRTATYVVRVTATGVTPAGVVKMTVAGKQRTVRLNTRGVAVVKVAFVRGMKLGVKAVTAAYQGNTFVRPARAPRTTTHLIG